MQQQLRRAIEFLATNRPELLAKRKMAKIYLMHIACNYAKKVHFENWDGCLNYIEILLDEFLPRE